MGLDLVTIPCLSDNYAFAIHNPNTGETAVIDVPEANPILEELASRNWTLSDVLLTHHHWDHVDGLARLLEKAPARVIGASADAHRLPPLDLAIQDGDTITVCSENCEVMDVSGHTVGHVAFHFPQSGLVFTADSLMALGCGRLFEGTPELMYNSLSKLAALPPETLICSGHEYTAANGKFAVTIEPDNARLTSRLNAIAVARAEGQPTVPSTLALELETNPFLRVHTGSLKANLGMLDASATEVFAEVRARKDTF
ncbi:MAG: hydroxyacylglutathione hydrolase [Marinovum sp.]|nr:hydroxyacylglutathione hydrolase [Marinovum sp.]